MNNENESPDVKTKNITLSSIIGWVLGVGCLLAGFGMIISNTFVGLLYILVALILIPPASKTIQDKLHIKLSKGLKFVLIIVIFIIIGSNMSESGDVVNTSVINDKQTNEVAINITATKIISDYKSNEVSADAMYKGNIIEVTGTVDTIGKDITDMPYIALSNGDQYSFERVQCMFTKNQESELANVSKGQSITLKGRVSGKLGNVLVRQCSIVK